MSNPSSSSAPKFAIAVVRIVVGAMFVLFGQFKIAGPGFAHGMIQQYLSRFLDQRTAVGWYRPFLEHVVQPHAVLFGYMQGWGEFLVGLALLTGVMVRPATIGGGFMMLNLILASWHGVGAEPPLWRYFANQNEHIGLLLLFLIFFADGGSPALSLAPVFRRRTQR